MSEPSLSDMDSIMKAAALEANNLQDAVMVDNEKPEIMGQGVWKDLIQSSGGMFNLAQIPNIEKMEVSPSIPADIDIKDALNNVDISSMLNKMSDNPDEISKLMTDSMAHMTPAMMEQARKLAGGQGEQIQRQMLKLGINPKAMQAQMKEQQKQQRALNNLLGNMTCSKRVIFITASRQAKSKGVTGDMKSFVAHLVHTDSPVELSCSRLALGPLAGNTIKLWYDPKRKGKNTRTSKIIGFPIAGEAVITMEEGDLTEEAFLAAEKLLA